MYRVSKSVSFCYGHRLLNYQGKCQNLHGHNARAVITLESSELDERGMVMDFSEVKQLVWALLDREIDHTLLLHRSGFASAAGSRRTCQDYRGEPDFRSNRPDDLRLPQGAGVPGYRCDPVGDREQLRGLSPGMSQRHR